MNLIQLAARVPWPLIAVFIASNVIPYLSALATRKPGWWTGASTVALSFVAALCGTLAQSGTPVCWREVLAVTAGAWLVARLHLNTFIKGRVVGDSFVENWLHAHGINRGTPAPTAPPA